MRLSGRSHGRGVVGSCHQGSRWRVGNRWMLERQHWGAPLVGIIPASPTSQLCLSAILMLRLPWYLTANRRSRAAPGWRPHHPVVSVGKSYFFLILSLKPWPGMLLALLARHTQFLSRHHCKEGGLSEWSSPSQGRGSVVSPTRIMGLGTEEVLFLLPEPRFYELDD